MDPLVQLFVEEKADVRTALSGPYLQGLALDDRVCLVGRNLDMFHLTRVSLRLRIPCRNPSLSYPISRVVNTGEALLYSMYLQLLH